MVEQIESGVNLAHAPRWRSLWLRAMITGCIFPSLPYNQGHVP